MTRFRDYHKNIKIRIAQIFLADMVMGAVVPFLAIYFSDHFGSKITGILLLLNVIIGLFIGFYGGYTADQMGRKKLMVIGGLIRLIAFAVMALANSPLLTSPELTFLMVLLISASFGLDGPAADAMLIDITKPSQRKGVYSLIYWSFNLAFAVGGIIGALAFRNYLFELLVVMTITSFVSAILVIFFIDETFKKRQVLEQPKNALASMLSSYKEVAKDKLFLWFILAGMLIQSIENQLENYIGIRLNEGMPAQSVFSFEITGVEMLGFLKSENTILVVILTAIVTRWVMKWKSEDRAFLISIVVFTVGYVGISYLTNIWLLFLFMVFATVGELMRVPIQQDYLAAIPTDEKRSSYMAMYGLVYNGSMMISAIFVSLGAVFSEGMMSFLILLTGLAGLFIIKMILPDLRKRRTKATINNV